MTTGIKRVSNKLRLSAIISVTSRFGLDQRRPTYGPGLVMTPLKGTQGGNQRREIAIIDGTVDSFAVTYQVRRIEAVKTARDSELLFGMIG